MLGRKPKRPEQGTVGRRVQRSGEANPAFSYYTSRVPQGERKREVGRPDVSKTSPDTARRYVPRAKWTALPFWLFVGLIALCGLKVLSLSTDPRVVIVGNSSVAARYLQSPEVYAKAAHRLLASSLTNRSKITVNLDRTATQLQREFPELQTVSLGIPLVSSRPIVYVQPAQPSVLVQNSSGTYALNSNGVVLSKLATVPAGIPVVLDQTDGRLSVGKQYLPSGTVSFVQTAAYQLGAAHISISNFILPAGTPYELDFHVSGQTYTVRCNLTENATVQSGAAIATLQRLGSQPPSTYLDVRTPGRVYYK